MKRITLIAVTSIALLAPTARLLGQNVQPDHQEQYAASDVAAGATLYNRLCVNCHGVSGTGVGGIDLHRGVLPRARTDEALRAVISTGFPQAGMPPFPLEAADLKALVAFVRAGSDASADPTPVALGNPALGRAVLESKGKCLTCHRIGDEGSFAGPDLSDIGRARPAASIRGSLLTPTAYMRPINRLVRAVKTDGTVITGRRLNEDTYTVQLMTDKGTLVSVVKADLKEWTVLNASPMGSYKDLLTPAELADLLAYLVSLKG
jgi:cytochrome c oxidase cbb3-type subunit III